MINCQIDLVIKSFNARRYRKISSKQITQAQDISSPTLKLFGNQIKRSKP